MIKSVYEDLVDKIRGFRSDPVESLGFIIPYAIGLSALLVGIIAYIIFIVNGGYTAQIAAVEEYGIFAGYDKKFTVGTTGMIFSGVGGIIIAALVALEFILIMTYYFIQGFLPIVMGVDLGLITIQTITTVYLINKTIGVFPRSYLEMRWVFEPFAEVGIIPEVALVVYGVIAVALIITFVFLLFQIDECKSMVVYSAVSLVISYGAIPLLLLFLQNIIPLVTGLLALIIIVVVVVVLFYFISLGGNSGSDNTNYKSNNEESKREPSKPVEMAPTQEVKKYNINTVFYVDKGDGLFEPCGPCIFYKDGFGFRQCVCSVEYFEKGKVAIVNKGVRVMNIAGCRRPQR